MWSETSQGILLRLISKADARKRGLKRYFTGRACPMGHVAEHYVSNGGCVECAMPVKRKSRKDID